MIDVQISLPRWLLLLLAYLPRQYRRLLYQDLPHTQAELLAKLQRFGGLTVTSESLCQRCLAACSVEKRGDFRIYLPQDRDFPPLLRTISPPLRCLFWRGPQLPLPGTAVIGSRKTTPRSQEAAQRAAQQLSNAGEVVISGLAIGSDTYAHYGSLLAGGKTLAVLPGGINATYPLPSQRLLDSILARGGACCSEYLPEAPVRPWQCVQRNRIQSALSRQVLLITSPEHGGSMHTVAWAHRQQRPVYVWPPALLTSKTCPLDNSGGENLLRRGQAQPWPLAPLQCP